MKLRDSFNAEEDVRTIAAGRHETWLAAVAGYLAMRKRKLLTGIADAASFDADKVRCRIKALREVGSALGAEMESIDPKAEAAIDKQRGMTREDHLIQLAFLLTPLGWRDKQLPALEKRREAAIAAWLDNEEPDQNLALAYELEQMITFLQAVESDALAASGRQSPVVGRLTDTGVSLRTAM